MGWFHLYCRWVSTGTLTRSVGAPDVDAAEDAEGIDPQCRCPISADTGLDVRAADQVETGHHDIHLPRNDHAYPAHQGNLRDGYFGRTDLSFGKIEIDPAHQGDGDRVGGDLPAASSFHPAQEPQVPAPGLLFVGPDRKATARRGKPPPPNGPLRQWQESPAPTRPSRASP